MGVGITRQPVDDEVHRSLECRALLVAVVRPKGVELFLAVIDSDNAEQVLKPAIEQRVAFHVEEHVSRARLRQARQTPRRPRGEESHHALARPALASLQPRLIAELPQRLGLDAVDGYARGQRSKRVQVGHACGAGGSA